MIGDEDDEEEDAEQYQIIWEKVVESKFILEFS